MMHRNKQIVLVGEAFGREEERYGRCFIGPSGQFLLAALQKCGLERHQVHITNVCMFRPTDDTGGNRAPTKEEIERELPRLHTDIAHFDIVVLLGRTAHETLNPYGIMPMSRVLGEPVVGLNRQLFLTIWHPAYVLRNPGAMPDYIRMLKKGLPIDTDRALC